MGLSVTDAWAEQLPVIKVNVWAFLYVPWARNPMCGPGHRGLGALKDGPGPGRPVLRQSLPTCHFENGTVINVVTCLEACGPCLS